uniref:Suppressor of IKBKE 1 n=1 Tax=Buteo japonicus TaxID=224669 RepID=A0A8C0BGU2_9AVES
GPSRGTHLFCFCQSRRVPRCGSGCRRRDGFWASREVRTASRPGPESQGCAVKGSEWWGSTNRASSWYRVPLGTCCHCREKLHVVCGNDVLYFAELWISLEEHQDALELIMSKYRKQMLQLLQGRKGEDAEPVLKVHQANSLEIESQIDRICEMGEVMRKAMQVDDDQFFKVQEKLAQLELENKELRELLSISKESFEVGREDLPDCEA